MSKETPEVFHKGSSCDYHSIVEELANEFEGQFECLGENTKNYNTFSIAMEKEVTNIDKDGNGSVITISYKMKFIDSTRFMVSSLSNLVEN